MPKFKNIGEFDELEEKKFLESQEDENSDEEETEEEETEHEESYDEDDLDEDDNDDDEEDELEEDKDEDDEDDEDDDEDEPQKEEPSKEDKKEYAFAQIRKEKKEYEEKYKQAKEHQESWDEIARRLGYKNSNELLEAENEKRMKSEAESKGMDTQTYRELQELKEKVETQEKEKKEVASKEKLAKFTSSLDNVAETYELKEKEKVEMLNRMETDGYDINDLYEIKNPKAFIKGYVNDDVLERKLREKLPKDKSQFKEKKFKNTGGNKKTLEETQDELIAKEMAKYRKENNL
jgi:hypothetical protein